MNTWLKTLVALLLALAVGVAGCSDDNGDNNGGDSDADQTSDAGDVLDTEDDVDEDVSDEDAGDTQEGDADAEDPDADDADSETDDATDGGDVDEDADTGRDCVEGRDSDYDGLTDCEELELGTDPNDHDTDGDGLSDFQELEERSDPLNPDSDGDGAQDGEEVELGLDPNDPDTYGDGMDDGDRWIFEACEDPRAEPVDFYTSTFGNWKLALPPAFNNHVELTISSATRDNFQAGAVYGDPANEVSGFLLSQQPPGNSASPTDVTAIHRTDVESIGNIIQGFDSGIFQTHDFRDAAPSRYLVETSQPMSVRELREQLLFEFAPFDSGQVNTTLPSTSGTNYTEFRVFISVIFREYSDGSEQTLTSLAVAPAQKFDSRDKVKFRMDDLTNTSNIAERDDGSVVRCNRFKPKQSSKADFYWVLDQSGSMSDDYTRVRNVANQFYSRLQNTNLDFRLGVTNMDEDFHGELRSQALWHNDLQTFLGEIQEIEDDPSGQYDCCDEYGLKTAQEGIELMKGLTAAQPDPGESIRPEAQLITIWMSDEEAQTIQNDGLSTSAGQQAFNNFVNFFSQHTIGFAIVEQSGEAYRQVALATGGSSAPLGAQDITETINDIIFAATGLASNYVLPETPISSSLRVFINGDWVPRSRENGFDYFASTNSIAFFGSFRPEPASGGDRADNIAVSYEAFQDRTKY